MPLNAEIASELARLSEVSDGEIQLPSRSYDDAHWIVSYTRDTGPVRYFHFDRHGRKVRFLFTSNSKLEDVPLATMHPAVIRSRDGFELVSYLTLPPGSAENGSGRPCRPLPMVLLVHGGPWSRDRWGYNPSHQFLADRGYAVLSVNFRGSTGFGKDFLNAGNRQLGAKMHDDLVDAVDWAVAERIALKERIAIMGQSYGGYATLVGLTMTPDLFACGVDIVGLSNLITALQSIPPYWKPQVSLFKARVGDHTTPEGRDLLLSRSPIAHVGEITRPLLIVHGLNDPRVRKAESDQIVLAMRKKLIPVTYVVYNDEGHSFVRKESNLSLMAIVEAFLAEHLGGKREPVGNAFDGANFKILSGGEFLHCRQAEEI
jgi:dipeptidyl aminopeptidase/acylaminoacyl peptidase